MGKIIYGTHIEVPAPFDAKSCDAMDTRLVVETKADLTTNAMATFSGTGKYCFVYEGIQVYVREDKSTYMYVGPNDGKNGILLSEVQKEENWRKLSDPTLTPIELGNKISKIQSDVIKNKVTNSDKTITVTPPENEGNTDIKVAIANADTNILKIGTDGLDTEITLKKVESVTDNTLASQYQLVGKNNKVLGTTIDIPKDRLLKDAKLGYANASVNESTGEITIGSAGASEIEGQPQYLILSMSIDTGAYKGVVVDLSQFLTEKEFKDGLVLEGNVVKGNVKTDDKFLGVDENGFFTKGIEDAIDSKIANLDKTDTAVAKKFVTSVSETDGLITVTRGEVTSKDKTVKMTDGTDGGFDVAVNIDGTTIIKNASSGVLSVASGALTQYKGSNAVKVSEVDPENNKTVSLSINSNDKVLTQSNDGLFADIKLAWDNKQGLKLIGKNSIVITTIPASDFIKDGMLDNATYDEETHKITLTFNTDAGKQPVELNLSDLVDTYEAGNGLGLTGKVFSIKKSAEADSEGFLKVGTDGIKVSGVQDAINTAAAKASNKIAEKSTGRVTVTAKVEADGHTTYTIAENDIASDSKLTGEINRAKASELKTNKGVGLNDDGSHKTTTGHYTAAATTIAGEISALDAQVHTNAGNITAYKNAIDNYTIGGAKISTNPVLTGENGVTVSGLAISLNLATDGNLEIGSNGLKLADTIDCGTYA